MEDLHAPPTLLLQLRVYQSHDKHLLPHHRQLIKVPLVVSLLVERVNVFEESVRSKVAQIASFKVAFVSRMEPNVSSVSTLDVPRM
jgi:hypothetical protein